jgi:hypothetical protein
MNKTIGWLCTAVFLASLGWTITQAAMTVKSDDPSLVDVGYVQASNGAVLEFKDGKATSVSGPGKYSVEFPVKRKIDRAIYTVASAACLLAAIALLKPEKAGK